jgi:hypothetical protein
MNEVYFHAVAYQLPATPGGLLGPRWVLSHHCTICRARVDPADLLSHAKAHACAGETAGHRPVASGAGCVRSVGGPGGGQEERR